MWRSTFVELLLSESLKIRSSATPESIWNLAIEGEEGDAVEEDRGREENEAKVNSRCLFFCPNEDSIVEQRGERKRWFRVYGFNEQSSNSSAKLKFWSRLQGRDRERESSVTFGPKEYLKLPRMVIFLGHVCCGLAGTIYVHQHFNTSGFSTCAIYLHHHLKKKNWPSIILSSIMYWINCQKWPNI